MMVFLKKCLEPDINGDLERFTPPIETKSN
jgi:hypothetical protein